MGSRMSLKAFLRVARSMELVDLSRPTVHLTTFLSPAEDVWCLLGDEISPETRCATNSQRFGGTVSPDGTVTLCQDEAYPCFQNWDFDAPVLRDGQASALNGFSCVAENGGITCTIESGRGFHIDANGVTELM
jgi:hypothetical protein